MTRHQRKQDAFHTTYAPARADAWTTNALAVDTALDELADRFPDSSTDNAIARFDGTTGKVIQNSGVIISDDDHISSFGFLTSESGFFAYNDTTGELQLVQCSAGTLQGALLATADAEMAGFDINNVGTVDGVDVSAHASRHASGGADALKLDDLATPDDNADLDATTGVHGLLPKLGGGTTNFLRADGTWAAPGGGSGDVVGPGSATDNALVRFDGTTGKLVQDGGVTADDSSNLDVPGNITVTGTVDGRDVATDGSKLDGVEAAADVTDATNVNTAGAVMESDYAAKGNVLIGTGMGGVSALAVGNNGQILIADSAEATGFRWGGQRTTVLGQYPTTWTTTAYCNMGSEQIGIYSKRGASTILRSGSITGIGITYDMNAATAGAAMDVKVRRAFGSAINLAVMSVTGLVVGNGQTFSQTWAPGTNPIVAAEGISIVLAKTAGTITGDDSVIVVEIEWDD